MTEEVILNGVDESPSVDSAEASLDNALASLKTASNSPEVNEPTFVDEQPVNKRETLKLPNKPQQEQESKFVEVEEPEVQKRINEIYRDKKIQEERNLLLQDELRRIVESAEEREAFLYNELQKIQNRHNQQDEEVALFELRRQYQEAIQNMDYDRAQLINEKLVDFKTEQKINSLIKSRNAEKPLPKKQNIAYSDPKDAVDATRLQSETGADGNLVRPWLQPGHPKFQDVIDIMAAVSNGYIRKGQKPSLSLIMPEIDKYMGIGNQRNTSQGQPSSLKHAPVLSSNSALNAGSENQSNKLNDLERTYAAKLGVSEKDYMRLRKYSSSGPISVDNFKK